MQYDTREKIAPLGVLSTEFEEHMKAHPFPPLAPPSAELRSVMEAQRIATQQPDTSTEYSVKITMRDGFSSEAHVHKPSAEGKHPLLVLLFGGGFMFGDCDQLSPYARLATKLSGVTVINLSYRRAPEYKFPTAPNDVWDGIQWITKNTETLQVDLAAGFVVGGVSAGGNLAAVTTQKAVDEGLSPPVTGLWLGVPWTLEPEVVPEKYKDVFFSREQCAGAPGLNQQAMDMFNIAYEPDLKSRDFSPFNAQNPHHGMPPTYIQVSGADPLRDDGLIYERALREAGVETKLMVYPNIPHLFPDFFQLKAFQDFHFDILSSWASLFKKSVAAEDIRHALANSPFASSS
ncbi:AB hydrolase superfamily protein [Colletotrichum fructicola]|uniref:AB hydrolase superfamily protein n=1 Tax=Colletotrichum fructicola (strain Nara gc5) TaxID=1213859 RepID=L2FJM3_COLFN|nr:AB hydrolase superfamily protein [Colletotrichum fructicola]KAF4476325.1 AB hydrolase superfamily protein [Colletotrichum fructicola Nara gc5]KAF4899783.1 AB hydrolase superfamily protein [Colletotrichum fructicola]KAF5484313.1 AB hydrolase superfamily protein [Colletotrichum fructicola]